MLKIVNCFLTIYLLLLFLPVNTAAGEWVIIDEIDTTKKPERIRYAKFLKERHYQIMNRIIPELTPDEKEWVKNRKKAITDALNSIKGKNTPENVDDIKFEMKIWSLLVHSLLDFPLKGTQLNQAISALEMNKGIVFPKGDKVNFLLTDMSSPIARGINFYIIFKYFNGKITK
jgi:hypothetical protein